ncbi:DUF2079 domain-containing protein [Patescibacteria group bacterium]|nr:DUF2079 domain-containing protein [Patescibacteria group bacterium]
MKEKAYKLVKFLIGWPLSIVALYFIWQIISPRSQNLLTDLKNIKLSLLAAGIICFILFYFLRGFIWHRLLKEYAYQIPLKQTNYLWAISELKRYIPGNIWSILGRTILFSQKGVKKRDSGILLIIEAQIFIISCTITSLLSIPFFLSFFLPHIPFQPFIVGIIIFTVICLSLLYIYNRNFRKKIPFIPKFHPKNTAFLIFISTISLLFFGLGNYFAISSVIFLHPQLLPQLMGFFCLTIMLGYLSFITPAGMGIREGILTIGLSKISGLSASAFASLFARIILIFAELIFIIISFLWTKINNKKLLQIEKWITYHPHETILFCLFLTYVLYFTITSFLRYDNFYTGRFDLGNMVQTVWNTSHGRIFILTDPNGTDILSRLAFHADFILILLTPFYFIWSNPKILLLIQSIIVGAGSFFIFLIAKDILKNKNLALVFSFTFLINPGIQRANLYDFHAVTLAIFFLLGTYYFYLKKKYIYFSIFAILAALTKEEIWLITGLFGLFIFLFHKKKVFGTAIFLISVSIFTILIWYAIPHALGSQHFALSYYSEFGNSPLKIIKTIIFSPLKTIGTILAPEHLNYLCQLFLPVGFLSLLAPLYLVFAAPDLLINLLSNNSQLHQIYYQYTAAINPFIFVAAIMGVAFLKKITKLPAVFFMIYLLIISLLSAYLFGPLPGAKGSNLDMYTRQLDERNFIDKYLSGIPKHLSVASTNNAGSHLSERQQIYTVPNGIEKADIVVFLLTNSRALISEEQMIEKLKQNDKYSLILEKNKFVVFKKI